MKHNQTRTIKGIRSERFNSLKKIENQYRNNTKNAAFLQSQPPRRAFHTYSTMMIFTRNTLILLLWILLDPSCGFQRRHNAVNRFGDSKVYSPTALWARGSGGMPPSSRTTQNTKTKEQINDREMDKARKTLEQTRLRKEAKTTRKAEQAAARNLPKLAPALPVKDGANYAQTTIWGANIIQCRPFGIDGVKKYDFLGGFTSLKALPIYPVPEIAFLGRSNVGKSSLLNCLTGLNKKVAIESKTPGRTQCINIFSCGDRDGGICNFADLPGYGYAKISKTQQDEISYFLKDYLQHRGSLRVAVLLVDVRREPQALDGGMIAFLKDEQLPFVIVATKVDKLKRDEVTKSLATIRREFDLGEDFPLVPFSAVTGEGSKGIWRVLRDVLMGDSAVLEDDEEYDGSEEEEDEEGGGEGDEGQEEDELEQFMR